MEGQRAGDKPSHLLDIAANRAAQKWSRNELIGRVVWKCAWPFFRLSPRLFWFWRRWLLRSFGATIGTGVRVFPTATIIIPWNLELGQMVTIGDRVNLYALGRITIGRAATISQGAHLCAGSHDMTRPDFPLLKLPITIGSNAWVCADAFVGPGINVGEGAVIGARAVAMKDVEAWTVVSGNPARVTGYRKLQN